jgi:hypothetical protein
MTKKTISLTIALLAVLWGPLISMITTRMQLSAASRRGQALLILIGTMREKWLESVRNMIGDFAGLTHHYWVAGFEDRADEDYLQLTQLANKIELMLNPKEDGHAHLISCLWNVEDKLTSSRHNTEAFSEAHRALTSAARATLKIEWDKLKEAS